MTDTLAQDACVVRNTAARKGRTQSVAPGPALKYLHYGRIILDAGDAPVWVETGDRETSLVCLGGTANVTAGDTTTTLARYDAIYVPRDATFEVSPGSDGCDVGDLGPGGRDSPGAGRAVCRHPPGPDAARRGRRPRLATGSERARRQERPG
jgi:hypothetical protein